jgi:hypothetical protein
MTEADAERWLWIGRERERSLIRAAEAAAQRRHQTITVTYFQPEEMIWLRKPVKSSDRPQPRKSQPVRTFTRTA